MNSLAQKQQASALLTDGDEKVSATILMLPGMSHTPVTSGQAHRYALFSVWVTTVLIQLQSVRIQSSQEHPQMFESAAVRRKSQA